MSDIIVGVDESEGAAAALRWAVAEAALHGWSVQAVMAGDHMEQHHIDEAFDPEYDQGTAERVLAEAVTRAVGDEAAATVGRLALRARPVPALLERATGARLLVVGARGSGGFASLLLGSVSDQCLHHAPGPIAIVHPGAEAGLGRHRRIVVGVDGSDLAQGALQWALAEGRYRGAEVDVVHAWQLPVATGMYAGTPIYPSVAEEAGQAVLDRAVDREDTGEVVVHRRLVCGTPARALLDAAGEADLVVVGSRGLGGFKSLLLGSVSRQLAHHAPCPVVVT